MSVWIEGADGCGKTGYGAWLADELGVPFIRETNAEDFNPACIEERAKERAEMLWDLERAGVQYVSDRSPISSVVYSRVHERGPPEHAIAIIEKMKPTVCYFRCDPLELQIRYSDEHQDDLAEIARTYDEVIEEYSDRFMSLEVFDTTTGVLDQLHSYSPEIRLYNVEG